MLPMLAPVMPVDTLPRWPWLIVSIGLNVLLLACIVRLWRAVAAVRWPGGALPVAQFPGAAAEPERTSGESLARLARSVESLRLSTELADVGVWFWDMASGMLEWSDRCKIHLALPPGVVPSMEHFYSVIHPDDRQRVRDAVDRSIAERQDYHAVYRIVGPAGTERRLAAMGRAGYDDDGRPTSMGGVTLDITRLAKIQDAFRQLQASSLDQAGELEESRRRFRLLAENVSDVLMETDKDGIIRWITPSVTLRIGCSPEEMVGRSFSHLVHPDDWERVRSMDDQVVRGAPTEEELRLRIANNGYAWFSVSVRPVFDAQRLLVGRLCEWRDVHRSAQIREAIAAERQRLHAMLTGMLDPLAIMQPVRDDAGHVVDFVCTDANPAACKWLGTERDHLLGARLLDVVPEAESSGLFRQFVGVLDTGRPVAVDDFPFRLHDVGLRRIDVRGVHVDGCVTFVWRDVTDRHEATEKIASSEEQFRLLAENSLDVVMRIDTNDTLLWISPSLIPVLGFAIADCVGHSALEFLATDESRERYARDKGRVLAGQGAVTRVQIRDATGVVHWAEVHSNPYRTPDGRIEGMVSSTRLIDAEVAAAEALERRARIDDLTQLLNRNELLARLDDLVSRVGDKFAVLWCDIDHFKSVNDTHGHAAGDAMLRVLGERIRGCLRGPDDLGARIGGDELIVVLSGVHDLADASTVAEHLRRVAAEPIHFDGETVAATLSIGVTLGRKDESVDHLLARADDAMYLAKEAGRNRVVATPQPACPAPVAALTG